MNLKNQETVQIVPKMIREVLNQLESIVLRDFTHPKEDQTDVAYCPKHCKSAS